LKGHRDEAFEELKVCRNLLANRLLLADEFQLRPCIWYATATTKERRP
jgi:hypothetical protein